MEKFFLSIMHSWGSDTPQEVFWSLNDLLSWANSKGFEQSTNYGFGDPLYDSEDTQRTNDILVKELSEWFENLK